ncbi:MAG: EscU/YscU/HrcU family type III secretion system export apparatus switch protein [Nitrospinae bacterium]|nr:EscU/YscU/HrcU family type III secretion system export apparatus switch protein [Nitrospinota bacterium]
MRRDKQQKAVALKYKKSEDRAPKVAAKGKGAVAEKIIAIAKEHGIPIREDADMVEVFSRLDLEEEIPPHLYKTVAELLAFIYRVNKSAPVKK